jgi:hypothetical protein
MQPAEAELRMIWFEYQTQFDVMQQSHTIARTEVPAASLQRYSREMVAVSTAKLKLQEDALAAAKTETSELKRLRKDDSLTGDHAAYTLLTSIHTDTMTQN